MTARIAAHRLVALTVTLLLVTAAHAVPPPGLFRAYLSSTGSDANDCTRPTPCRLLPAALNAVADGGEIWMLDSANFNTSTVTIGKSVSILAIPGAVGSVVATGGPAIGIPAGSLRVALRNLVIVPLPGAGGTRGVELFGASSLIIEESLIANQPGEGVLVNGTGTLTITNTILRNNGGFAVNAQDGATVSISGSRMLGNGGGVVAQSGTALTTQAAVSDTIITGGSEGVYAYAGVSQAFVNINVARCTIQKTISALRSTAVVSDAAAEILVSASMIANNNASWNVSGSFAFVESFGNNHFGEAAGFGALTPATLR